MDKEGQLTFSDDPLVHEKNEALLHIEEGNFSDAVEKIDKLLTRDPQYPGLVEGYRTARFWNNRLKELNSLEDGRRSADFLMKEWSVFDDYAKHREMTDSAAYYAAMKYVFFKASEHYKTAYKNQEDTSNSFSLLVNLGECFIKLQEFSYAIETLEYARTSYRASAKLHALLGEAYFHEDDIPKSLLHFREAFFIDPQEIDLDSIKAKPIQQIDEVIQKERPQVHDVREWIPIYGFTSDILYVKRNLTRNQVQSIENDIYTLEVTYQKMNKDQIDTTGVLPRLLNKYLWLLDYYEFQQYNFENLSEIRNRLINLENGIFADYFKNVHNP